MAMSDITYQPFTGPQIRSPEEGLLDDYDYTLSSSSDYGHAMMESGEYPSAYIDASQIHQKSNLARTAQIQQRLSNLTRSAAGYPSYSQQVDADPHGSPYYIGNIPFESDWELQALSQQRTRYTSPNGSCGGDRSATASSVGEQTWSPPRVYPDVQALFSTSVNELFQNPDNMGSHCGSDCSVSPKELQHYPDPISESNPPFDDRMILESTPRSVPPFLSQPIMPLEAFGQQIHQDEPMFGERIEEFNEPTDPTMEGFYSGDKSYDYSRTVAGMNLDSPYNRTRYSDASSDGSSSPISPRTSFQCQKENSKCSSGRKEVSKQKQKSSPASKRAGKRGTASRSRGANLIGNRQSNANRVFPCTFSPYGCTSSFGSKNEWKRHVLSQHLQLGFYRCDVGHCKVTPRPTSSASSASCSSHFSNATSPASSASPFSPTSSLMSTIRSPNDFNRKDLFTQHLRRMHAPWLTVPAPREPTKEEREAFDKSLDEVRARCWVQQRKPPQRSQCNYCGEEFSGPHCWEARMEHIGKHCERGDVEKGEDLDLRRWAIKEGVIKAYDTNKWVLASILNGNNKNSWEYSALGE